MEGHVYHVISDISTNPEGSRKRIHQTPGRRPSGSMVNARKLPNGNPLIQTLLLGELETRDPETLKQNTQAYRFRAVGTVGLRRFARRE